jgi:hypothetical protein
MNVTVSDRELISQWDADEGDARLARLDAEAGDLQRRIAEKEHAQRDDELSQTKGMPQGPNQWQRVQDVARQHERHIAPLRDQLHEVLTKLKPWRDRASVVNGARRRLNG